METLLPVALILVSVIALARASRNREQAYLESKCAHCLDERDCDTDVVTGQWRLFRPTKEDETR